MDPVDMLKYLWNNSDPFVSFVVTVAILLIIVVAIILIDGIITIKRHWEQSHQT